MMWHILSDFRKLRIKNEKMKYHLENDI